MSGMHIIRIVLLVISTTGYILFLTKKIQVEFAVGVTFAAISVSLFLAGILNRLPEAAILLFFGGFICLDKPSILGNVLPLGEIRLNCIIKSHIVVPGKPL